MNCQLKLGSCLFVSGPSSSGKTIFILNIIGYAEEIFDTPPTSTYWYYGAKTDKHDELLERGFKLFDTLPTNFDKIPPRSFIVLDDMMETAKNSHVVTSLFTRYAHHAKFFVIYSTQNLFHQSREARTRSLNSQYMTLFKNPREVGKIKILAAQMYPQKTYLEDCYKDATEQPHSYLFIDMHQGTSELIRCRAHILPNESPMIAYVDKQIYNEGGCIL